MAAKKLGHKEVPTIRLEHLSEVQKKAYILADNKIALNSTWNDELLGLELSALEDAGLSVDLTGFSLEEYKALGVPDFDPASEDEQGKLDQLDPKWICCPNCGKEFDARQA
jgi:ParB-like chromosome segregation protein Spo0J